MMGNPLCASKADERDSPVLTRVATSSSCGAKVGVLLALGQHLERAQDRQAGADQGEELLVEDEKRLQLDLRRRQPGQPPRALHREDVVAGMREARAQLFGGGRSLHLLLHPATLIGQLDDELCHFFRRRRGPDRPFLDICPVLRIPAWAHLFP